MATVEVQINGRQYPLNCEPGQEGRLRGLAAYIDRRIGELSSAHGNIGDTRLLLLTSLLIADELSDAFDEIKRLRNALNGQQGPNDPASDEAAAAALDQATTRLDALAGRLGDT